MTDADRLTMLKIDLGISAEVYDQRLTRYLQAAQTEIEREGMPRMLRYALNNRLLSQKARTEDG